MMSTKTLVAALLFLPLVACLGNSVKQAAETRSNHGFSSIRLQRTACFGRCPVYQISLTADGLVTYVGNRNVAVTGKQSVQVDRVVARAKLWDILLEAGFMQLPSYVPGKANCQRVATDMPTINLTATRNGESHSVKYYTGCLDAPESLKAIANQVDKAANSSRWLEGAVSM